jgi:valyl-tRNA synthetase
MDSRYNSQQHEDAIYELWQKHDAFNPDSVNFAEKTAKSQSKTNKKTFTIMMPPPNANDPLHIGHAIFLTIEDIMIRYHRMIGDETLWLPGTDHAGIETQFVFEKKLKKQKKSRFDFDRQTLYQMIWEYVQENSDTAVNQMKKIGASADWSRFRFMLDQEYVDVVLDTFIRLHEEKLIYRDFKLVNYSPSAGTSYSDLEINYVDATSPLYYIKYYLISEKIDIPSKNDSLKEDENGQYVVVATTRPEPLFADTHLAVHPDNPKTQFLIGKQVANPLTNEPMQIIVDSFVDPEFGTGIVKLTPAHDHTDFEVAQRHNLPIIEAIDTHGRIKENGGELAGLKVKAAREKVVEILTAKNAIDRIDTTYQNRVATDYKSGQPIEPIPLAQFFVKVKPLTEPILQALDDNSLTIHGAGHDKILKHWLTNLRDWNISRQIVWGIRIPVWYDVTKNPHLIITFLDKNKETISDKISNLLSGHNQNKTKYSLEEIAQGLQTLQAPIDATYKISKIQPGPSFIQETDTFDTWFSSAQWPFATLKSLDIQNGKIFAKTNQSNFERFYPTQVMETGYDILPFWVMRMLIIGHFATGKLPFKDVYLHGLVRDQNGKKMSKSKGNVINPLEVIESYGADALRMALVIRSTAGLDKSVGIADFKASRNLTNKMWNAARFVQILGKKNQEKTQYSSQNKEHSKAVVKFESKLKAVVSEVTNQIELYRFGLAAETLYNEFWHWYCDQAIESTKSGELPYSSLYKGLKVFLKLFHPFMPFVTEAIWQEIVAEDSNENTLLITAEWPT